MLSFALGWIARRLLFAAICVAGTAFLASCGSRSVVTVNGQAIGRAAYELRLRSSPLAQPILRTMIMEVLIEQYAHKNGIKVDPSEVDAQEAAMKEQFPGSSWQEMLASRHLTQADARTFVRDHIILDKAVAAEVKVTPRQIEAYFVKNRRSFPGATLASATPQIRDRLAAQQKASMSYGVVEDLVDNAHVVFADPRFNGLFFPHAGPNQLPSDSAAEAAMPLTLNLGAQ